MAKKITRTKKLKDVKEIKSVENKGVYSYNGTLARILNELNLIDNKEKLKWIPKDKQKFTSNINDPLDLRLYCTFYKLEDLNFELSEEHKKQFQQLKEKYEIKKTQKKIKPSKENSESKTNDVKKKSVQDHLREKALNFISEIDGAVDEIVKYGETKFDINSFVKTNSINTNQPLTRMMISIMEKEINELNSIPKDEELQEYYPDYKKTNFKRMVKFLNEVKDKFENIMKIKRVIVRKKKPTDIAKLVSKLRNDSVTFGKTTSVHPMNIIGKNYLVGYVHEKRKVFVIIGDNITVKGKSFANIDIEKSYSFMLPNNKVEEFFNNDFSKIGKRAIENLLKVFDKKKKVLTTPRIDNKLVFLKAL